MEGKSTKIESQRNARTSGALVHGAWSLGEEIVANVGKGREENAGTAHLRSNEVSLSNGTTREVFGLAWIYRRSALAAAKGDDKRRDTRSGMASSNFGLPLYISML